MTDGYKGLYCRNYVSAASALLFARHVPLVREWHVLLGSRRAWLITIFYACPLLAFASVIRYGCVILTCSC